ncbi:hypothetical protein LIER_22444 [Lithospermum erythrorhizon]|uniref:Uncharacterized protein n=1 Tax=Lithospermum erythrorhizon TaxID=34254 RepID=A0AAV3QW82_LITER
MVVVMIRHGIGYWRKRGDGFLVELIGCCEGTKVRFSRFRFGGGDCWTLLEGGGGGGAWSISQEFCSCAIVIGGIGNPLLM